MTILSASDSGITSIGPIHVLTPSSTRTSYSWEATVDSIQGLASSKETSNIVSSSLNKTKHVVTQNSRIDPNFGGGQWLFEAYPIWMCRGSVSFGLLKALEHQKKSYRICTRIGGIHLLTFDRPQRSRQKKIERISTFLSRRCLLETVTVTIPIIGGQLTSGEYGKNNGELLFSINTKTRKEMFHPVVVQQNISTEIRNYKPKLCGSRVPIHKVRARIYLSTQSIIHSFVMWRFHHHVSEIVASDKRR
jgi:hypothetical protein